MSEDERDEDIEISQGAPRSFPEGDQVVGPGTVRQGSGYSGTTSGEIPTGTGHDPSPYDPPSEGYMGDTTSSDEPAEEVIDIVPDEE
ncbi:MAG TPA: hypothetical protein VFA78_09845 [Chloroflexota bacterium]|nr:hypothetical protein [Chloroflexota bacterium]